MNKRRFISFLLILAVIFSLFSSEIIAEDGIFGPATKNASPVLNIGMSGNITKNVHVLYLIIYILYIFAKK